MFFKKSCSVLFITALLLMQVSAEEQKAGSNLMGKEGNLGDGPVMNSTYARISIDKEKPLQGEACLKTVPVGKGPKITHYAFYKQRFIPFKLKPGRNYSISIFAKTEGGARGRLAVELYDENKKYIKKLWSSYAKRSNWQKISVNFYPPKNCAYAVPIFYLRGDETSAVYWDKFSVSFSKSKQLVYFKKKSDEVLNISGKLDKASFPDISADDKVLAKVSLKDPLNKEILFTKEYPLKDLKLDEDIDLSGHELGIYRFTISVYDKGKELWQKEMTYLPGLDCAWKEMERFHKETNNEVGVKIKEAKKIEASEQENERGFILFNRPEPRWIQPDSLPFPDEKVKSYARTAAPGDYIFFTVALLPLRDLDDVELKYVSDKSESSLKGTLGTIRYMPQQTNYSYYDKIPKYWILPEIIDDMKPANLKQGLVQQYSLRLKVPETAKGISSGKWVVNVKGEKKAEIPVSLDTLPVKLSQPEDQVFGLYIDPVRWIRNKKFTDDKILEELKDVKEHGYNSLYLAVAPPVTSLQIKDGVCTLGLDYFKKTVKLAADTGFNKQPYILDPYAMERTINARIDLPAPKGREYTPEYKKYVDQFFKQIKETMTEEGLPEPLIHGVDEATHGEKLDESIRVLKAAKEHGFRTVCSTFQWCIEKNPDYEKVLDFRNYGCPGFWEMRTPERAEKLRKDTEKAGDVFWAYGSGCYANANPPGPKFRDTRQDGCLTENRYMHGLFVYRAKVKAEWSWCFSRWRGKAENDFDDPRRKRGEVKDQCIVYPVKDSAANKDTLQWEALRQGWQDFRAISTLDKLLKTSENAEAQSIKSELEKKINEIPWQNYTQFPNQRLDELRGWILKKIYELQNEEKRK